MLGSLAVSPASPAPLPTGLAVVSVPLVLSAVGFTGAGITASSLAAKMMSVTAIANGGGVPAGSLVATLQSVGECPAGACFGRDERGIKITENPPRSHA